MGLLNKLEKKFGRYAIPNLMMYIMALYACGFVLNIVNPYFYYQYLALDAAMILKGQIWRIITFIIYPPATDILYFALAMYLYYMLGTTLERVWGSFRFNLYYFMGMLFNVLAALVVYLTMGTSILLTTSFINFSLFFAFAATFPDTQFLLFFFIPIKAKWMALLNAALFAVEFVQGNLATRVAILMALMNFIVYFIMAKKGAGTFKQQRARVIYKNRAEQARKDYANTAARGRHKCAICGRTEKDDPTLEFRFCSKCAGSYEYCQYHLYTHTHVTGNESPQRSDN